ncbi:MAG: hypothetical protein M1812_005694 [Candelaria pacifica]|nr:MAG: hypothetical protein M1812_005694 [Candelaria pacifica]
MAQSSFSVATITRTYNPNNQPEILQSSQYSEAGDEEACVEIAKEMDQTAIVGSSSASGSRHGASELQGEQLLPLEMAMKTRFNVIYKHQRLEGIKACYLEDGPTLESFFDMMSSAWHVERKVQRVDSLSLKFDWVNRPMKLCRGDRRTYQAMLENIAKAPCWKQDNIICCEVDAVILA